MREVILLNTEQTLNLGQSIARSLTTGSLIYLHGDLGAGKTTFAQGFIGALGDYKVLSPTYAYVQSYPHTPMIHHFDLYRVENPEQILELNLDSLLDDDSSIRLVEWPENLGYLAKEPHMDIRLEKINEHRKAIINGLA